jgi:hypothetical protein
MLLTAESGAREVCYFLLKLRGLAQTLCCGLNATHLEFSSSTRPVDYCFALCML